MYKRLRLGKNNLVVIGTQCNHRSSSSLKISKWITFPDTFLDIIFKGFHCKYKSFDCFLYFDIVPWNNVDLPEPLKHQAVRGNSDMFSNFWNQFLIFPFKHWISCIALKVLVWCLNVKSVRQNNKYTVCLQSFLESLRKHG